LRSPLRYLAVPEHWATMPLSVGSPRRSANALLSASRRSISAGAIPARAPNWRSRIRARTRSAAPPQSHRPVRVGRRWRASGAAPREVGAQREGSGAEAPLRRFKTARRLLPMPSDDRRLLIETIGIKLDQRLGHGRMQPSPTPRQDGSVGDLLSEACQKRYSTTGYRCASCRSSAAQRAERASLRESTGLPTTRRAPPRRRCGR